MKNQEWFLPENLGKKLDLPGEHRVYRQERLCIKLRRRHLEYLYLHHGIWSTARRTSGPWKHCNTALFCCTLKVFLKYLRTVKKTHALLQLLPCFEVWSLSSVQPEFNGKMLWSLMISVSHYLYLLLDMLHLFCSCQPSHVICLINIYKYKLLNWIHLEIEYGSVIFSAAFVYGYNYTEVAYNIYIKSQKKPWALGNGSISYNIPYLIISLITYT